ncbi:reverse transcriptase [Senna tora]|uniref:Reverse transcriptase n=1 Tax=Senna tora TaxID=362788 RepID=A0A834SFF5_9FABA|nr:reverse transcriptase [Senna tora]
MGHNSGSFFDVAGKGKKGSGLFSGGAKVKREIDIGLVGDVRKGGPSVVAGSIPNFRKVKEEKVFCELGPLGPVEVSVQKESVGLRVQEVLGEMGKPVCSPSGYVVEIPSDERMEKLELWFHLTNLKASISVFMEESMDQVSGSFQVGKSGSKKGRKRERRREKIIKDETLVDVPSSSDELFPKDLFRFGVHGKSGDGVRVVAEGFGGWPSAATQGHGFYVDACGKSGGLAVWWKEELDLKVLFSSKNLIHIELSSDGETPIFVSLVYGPPKEDERRIVWDRLRVFGSKKLLEDYGLFDLEYNGPLFTWINKRVGEAHIKEKLDWVLGNLELFCLFPKGQVFVNPLVGSDHCALVVDMNFVDQRSPRCFRFEMFWVDHLDYKEIVSRGWDACYGEDLGCFGLLVKKLESCKEILSKWSKKAFPNCI